MPMQQQQQSLHNLHQHNRLHHKLNTQLQNLTATQQLISLQQNITNVSANMTDVLHTGQAKAKSNSNIGNKSMGNGQQYTVAQLRQQSAISRMYLQLPAASEQYSQYSHQLAQVMKQTQQQIAALLEQYHILNQRSQQVTIKCNKLRHERVRMMQQLTRLRQQLHITRNYTNKTKKLQEVYNRIHYEYQCELMVVNKLQAALNNAISLQYQMADKVRAVEGRQLVVQAKIDREHECEFEIAGYRREGQRWEQLMQRRAWLLGQIQQVQGRNSGDFFRKLEQKQQMVNRIKGVEELYGDIEVAVTEQQYIIRQIMDREGVSAYQLYEAAVQEYEGEEGKHSERDNEVDREMTVFRRGIGSKTKTQPVYGREEREDSVLGGGGTVAAPQKGIEAVEKYLRLTAKITHHKNQPSRTSHTHNKPKPQQRRNSVHSSLPRIPPKPHPTRKHSLMPVTHLASHASPQPQMRIRLKDGYYKYYPTPDKYTSRQHNHQTQPSIHSHSHNTSTYSYMGRQDRQISETTSQEDHEGGGIRLRLVGRRRRGRASQRQLMESRESDTEESAVTQRVGQATGDGLLELQKGQEREEQMDQYQRQRLNTIHEGQQQIQNSQNH